MISLLRGLVSTESAVLSLAGQSQPQLLTTATRIDARGRPLDLLLGKKRLRLYPDTWICPRAEPATGDWLLVDPERFATEITGFARIRPGETLMVGRADDSLATLLDLPKTVMKRHLTITNEGGGLLLRPLDSEKASYAGAAEDAAGIERLTAHRTRNLRRLRRIFGGSIEMLEPETALTTLEQFYAILETEAYRPLDSRGRPGGLVDLPDRLTPVIVGDLHASIDNLLKILSEDHCLQALREDKAALVILGDAIHSEADGQLEEMESSLLMLDLLFRLKIRFPANVFYIRGNHESFDEEVAKAGVPQGRLLFEAARALRGKKYAKRLAEVFESLAYVVKSSDIIAVHAGAPRSGVSLKHLVNLHQHPKLARELCWTRLRQPSRPAGYGKKDVKALRKTLGVDKHTPLIVGHTPQSREGSVWTDVGDIKGHHVVYSARAQSMAVMVRVRGKMVALQYLAEPGLQAYANSLRLPQDKGGPPTKAGRPDTPQSQQAATALSTAAES